MERKAKRQKRDITTQELEELILFETSHSVKPSRKEFKEATTCPRCNGTKCRKSFHGYNITSYIRGNGYLDKAGVNREMNLYHLTSTDEQGQTLDPYAEHRLPGEVDEIKTNIRKAGQHRPNARHYTSSIKPARKRK